MRLQDTSRLKVLLDFDRAHMRAATGVVYSRAGDSAFYSCGGDKMVAMYHANEKRFVTAQLDHGWDVTISLNPPTVHALLQECWRRHVRAPTDCHRCRA